MFNTKIVRGWRSCHLQSGGRLARPALRHAHLVRGASNQPCEPDAGASKQELDDIHPELRDLQINEDGFLIDTKTGKVINEMGATRFDVAVRALRGELDPPSWVENSERTSGVILSALYQFPRAYLFQVVGRPTPSTATVANTDFDTDADASTTTAGPSISGALDGQATPVDGSSIDWPPPAAASGRRAASVSGWDGNESQDQQSDKVTSAEGDVRSSPSCGKAAFVRDILEVISRVTQAPVDDGQVEVKERFGGKYLSVAVDVVVRAPELVSMVYDELAKDPRVIMKF
ncbi:hypothetical protein Vretimale_15923 [Volvox reticuliferus]|uniref:Uncharacterized protein n=2 Tax=Volvox reticuliferus TaxID=1737510 RepID=A0A8J4FQ30_9CHLO|nr:hypothetical protein Vretifemale_12984 [Volvox reticuliferus]GIM12571.1 hypothetical protein Vretimale_15923 [Volvox reticuliferus]